MSGNNTNFPAGFNPDDAQALVATMTAKLQKKVSNSQAELANTMAVMQVQSTKASYASALSQAMMGIDQAVAWIPRNRYRGRCRTYRRKSS